MSLLSVGSKMERGREKARCFMEVVRHEMSDEYRTATTDAILAGF